MIHSSSFGAVSVLVACRQCFRDKHNFIFTAQSKEKEQKIAKKLWSLVKIAKPHHLLMSMPFWDLMNFNKSVVYDGVLYKYIFNLNKKGSYKEEIH